MSSPTPPEPPGRDARDRGEAEPPPPPPPAEALGSPPPDVALGLPLPAPSGPPVLPAPRRGGTRDGRSPRRGWLIALVALVIAVPAGLAAAVVLAGPADPAGEGTAEAGDRSASEAEGPTRPDVADLSGRDAVLADLLGHVDASERAMIDFQERLAEVVGAAGGRGPEEVLAEVQDAAEVGTSALAEVRGGLVEPVGNRQVEEIRVAYLAHHDAWADYLEAVAEEPAVVGGESENAQWQLSINLSAELFARELRAVVDDGLAGPVRAYATEILERGFERQETVPDV